MVDYKQFDIEPGQMCSYCGEKPAQEKFKLFPCWYFCSMECKREYYDSPDEFPKKGKK